MSKRGRDKTANRPIVIRKSAPQAGHAHHGGAWKIAYADFVTAMMAFFLLMWLVNATTDAQRRGIADYFAPTNPLARGQSGSGEPFGGRSLHSAGTLIADTPMAAVAHPTAVFGDPPDDNEQEDRTSLPMRRAQAAQAQLAAAVAGAFPPPASREQQAPPRPRPDAVVEAAQAARDAAEATRREAITRAAEEIREAVRNDPALAALARQLLVEEVAEGLRVQLVDAEGQPVFQTGQAAPNDRGRALLGRVAAVLARLPHPVEITGHTDASPFRGSAERTNWDLSADRANATRRLLVENGVAEGRIRGVAGRADRELLLAGNPLDPANRRVAVLMLLPPAIGAAR